MKAQEKNSEPRHILESTLRSALEHIIQTCQQQGHWGDIRSTAVATWALAEFVSYQAQFEEIPKLQMLVSNAQIWLASQIKNEEGGVSWESEAWDTSLAILALTFSNKFNERRDQGAAWLQRIRRNSTGAWYDEIWETVLSVIALLRAETVREGPKQALTSLVKNVLSWLCELPSKPSGEFINPHYSGFIVWLLAEILDSYIRDDLEQSVELIAFTQKVDATVLWLIERASADPSELWGPYTFSTAYITYGLSKLAAHRPCPKTYMPVAINWFMRQQGRAGGYEDTEDTALAVLALTNLLPAFQIRSNALLKDIYNKMPQPTVVCKCFLGYSGQSSSLADQIKNFISQALPNVVIMDWKWDFRPGRILFSEIEKASRECTAALFLVTKDDKISGPKRFSTPRDNIIFEVGFFAARLGMDSTVLIVEKDTQLPADWGGILYILLKNKNDIASIHAHLLASLKRIFRL